MANREHEFGSLSTDLKLSMVAGYLKAFTTALQNKPSASKPFQLWYIDAFAGTGERTVKVAAQEANLLEPSSEARTEARRGSARIAIETDPPFDRLVFMDLKPKHVAALEALKAEYPNRDITVIGQDANEAIQREIRWDGWRSTRAVLFLDPYGMNVEWETLKAIQQTEAIDVWYLVSLSGLYRQATNNSSKLDEGKRAALTRMLGTDEWEKAWYDDAEQVNLFEEIETERQRTKNLDNLERFVTERFKTLFPGVYGPRRLFNDRGHPMFSLYFLVSNPSPKARVVTERIANHILKAGSSSQVRPK